MVRVPNSEDEIPKLERQAKLKKQKVAGYSTHTFSEDFKYLTTYIYNWEGQLLHQFNTEKGTGGEPGSDSSASSGSSDPNPNPVPPSPPNPNPSPVSGCCEMNQKAYCPP